MKPGFKQRTLALAGACLLAFAPVTASAQWFAAAPDFAARAAVTGVLQKPLSRAQRAQILAALETAPSHGLPGYNVSEQSSDNELARAAVSYASALRGGRMAGKFIGDWHLRPEPYDAASNFQMAVRKNKLRPWFEQLAPQHRGYAELREALAFYRDIEASGGWKKLSAGKTALKPGAKGPAVLALRERLGMEYAAPAPEGDPSVFDPSLAAALKAEQERLGAPVTGILDKTTLAALNVPASARVDTIEANLERWRWLPGALPPYRVEVNLPNYWIEVHRNGQIPLAMKVIVGKPSDPTPMFQDTMESVVFNPPWNVPEKIARNELWPKAKKDKAYFAKHDYIVTESGGLQQKAGPKSALGKIKFNLGNPFAIYLHDTPSRQLFDEDVRAFSHGCMRVEKPLELANMVLADDREWTPDTVDQTIASGDTVRTDLGRPTPVFVVYRTAFVENGRVQFRDDLYGWDRKLKEILAPI